MNTDLYAAADELFLTALAEGKVVRLHVDGTSMLPLLKPGDVVVLQRVESHRLQKGDLVVVRREHDLVTHRLVWQRAGQWLTKGDNLRYMDPPIDEQAILGKVIAVERDRTIISLQGVRWQFVNRWLARLGWLEAVVFHFGRRLHGSSSNFTSGRGDEQGSILARLAAAPFRLAARLLVH
jgi:signal peptidase I